MRTPVPDATEALLPDALKALWKEVEAKRATVEAYTQEQERHLAEYKQTWSAALMLDGQPDLKTSLLAETGLYVDCDDLAEVERRCRLGVAAVREEWESKFRAGDTKTVEKFYDQSKAYIYDLMWWHTLTDDASPLAYVLALRFAKARGCTRHLDFGAGSGAGGLLFARNGFETTLADISSSLLDLSRWRFDLRKVPANFLDLKSAVLPTEAFDVVTAMDVFEHLVDPVAVTENIAASLRPGGFLIGRFDAKIDAEHPQHIVADFEPTFRRMSELGLVEVWRDEWLWGHQFFQKRR
jgi:mycofactocin glycosyltransferase